MWWVRISFRKGKRMKISQSNGSHLSEFPSKVIVYELTGINRVSIVITCNEMKFSKTLIKMDHSSWDPNRGKKNQLVVLILFSVTTLPEESRPVHTIQFWSQFLSRFKDVSDALQYFLELKQCCKSNWIQKADYVNRPWSCKMK